MAKNYFSALWMLKYRFKSSQIANGQYKDYLVGQLTNTKEPKILKQSGFTKCMWTQICTVGRRANLDLAFLHGLFHTRYLRVQTGPPHLTDGSTFSDPFNVGLATEPSIFNSNLTQFVARIVICLILCWVCSVVVIISL